MKRVVRRCSNCASYRPCVRSKKMGRCLVNQKLAQEARSQGKPWLCFALLVFYTEGRKCRYFRGKG